MEFVNNTDSVLIFINTSYEYMYKLNPSASFFTDEVPLFIVSEYGLIVLNKTAPIYSTSDDIRSKIMVNDSYGAFNLSFLGDNAIEIFVDKEYQGDIERLKEKYMKARKKAKRFKRKYLELRSILENSVKNNSEV